MSKRALAIVSLLTLIGATTWVMCSSETTEPAPTKDTLEQAQSRLTPVLDVPTPALQPHPLDVEAELEQGALLVVQDARGQLLGESASIQLSAAGLYPPLLLKTDGDGRVRAPIPPNPMLNEQDDGPVEVLVRAEDGARGFWGVVSPIKDDQDDEPAVYAMRVVPAPSLKVYVVDEAGNPIAATKVRLALSDVHLLHRRALTGETGKATFDQLPEGEYSLEIDAPGFVVRRLNAFQHTSEQKLPLSVTVQPTREVYGCLVDEQGAGVPDATILGHAARRDTSWFAQTLQAEEVVRVDGPPIAALTQTDFDGCFSLTGLPAGEVYIQSQVAWAPPSVTGPFDVTTSLEVGPVELTLSEGSTVRVRVVGESQQPIAGATVQWVDVVTGRAGVGTSNLSGEVVFVGLSTRVSIEASLGSWRSPSIRLGSPEGDGSFLVTTQLGQPSTLVSWTLRLNAPRGVEPVEARASLNSPSGAVVCQARSLNERDWRFEGCPKGLATIHVNTASHGTWQTQKTIGDDVELVLPTPRSVRVHVHGIAREAYAHTTLQWNAADSLDERHQGTLTPLDDDTLQWKGSLYPGTYAFGLDVKKEAFARTFDVKASTENIMTWPVVMPHRLRVRVLDARGGPVEGAMLRVVEDNVVSDTLQTSKRAGLKLKSNATNTLLLWAVSARQGEGLVRVPINDELPAEVTLRLERGLFETRYPGRILDIGVIESTLGSPIVNDDDSLLLDITRRDSAAYKAGIPRGARLLDMRRVRGAIEVTFMHDSKRRQVRLKAP